MRGGTLLQALWPKFKMNFVFLFSYRNLSRQHADQSSYFVLNLFELPLSLEEGFICLKSFTRMALKIIMLKVLHCSAAYSG